MTDIHSFDSILIICITIYWFIEFAKEAFYIRRLQDYFDSCDKDEGMHLYYDGFCYLLIDPKLEEARSIAEEIANMTPYEFGWYSYFEDTEFCDINETQKNGYLDAKFEVEQRWGCD